MLLAISHAGVTHDVIILPDALQQRDVDKLLWTPYFGGHTVYWQELRAAHPDLHEDIPAVLEAYAPCLIDKAAAKKVRPAAKPARGYTAVAARMQDYLEMLPTIQDTSLPETLTVRTLRAHLERHVDALTTVRLCKELAVMIPLVPDLVSNPLAIANCKRAANYHEYITSANTMPGMRLRVMQWAYHCDHIRATELIENIRQKTLPHRRLAFAMHRHERLGAQCKGRHLPPELLDMVLRYVD